MFFINHVDFGKNSASIIEMEGQLDSESSPDFDEYIDKLLEKDVIYMLLDMKKLNYVSSEGIGAVLMIQKRISIKNGLAIFFNLNFEVSSLFKLLGFDKVLTIASNRAEALQILDKRVELFPGNEDEPASLNIELPKSKPSVKEKPDIHSIKDGDEINSFETFIIECIRCRSLIRINDFGDHHCPYCGEHFTVTDEKKAVFRISR